MIITTTTYSAEETKLFASNFADNLKRGDVVALFGELGSGKTQFVKGICEKFNVNNSATSPSFVILNRYEGKDKNDCELLLYHFDLYRVKSVAEMYDIGFEEYVKSDGICLIEWAELLGELLPNKRYEVRINYGSDEEERKIEIKGINIK